MLFAWQENLSVENCIVKWRENSCDEAKFIELDFIYKTKTKYKSGELDVSAKSNWCCFTFYVSEIGAKNKIHKVLEYHYFEIIRASSISCKFFSSKMTNNIFQKQWHRFEKCSSGQNCGNVFENVYF